MASLLLLLGWQALVGWRGPWARTGKECRGSPPSSGLPQSLQHPVGGRKQGTDGCGDRVTAGTPWAGPAPPPRTQCGRPPTPRPSDCGGKLRPPSPGLAHSEMPGAGDRTGRAIVGAGWSLHTWPARLLGALARSPSPNQHHCNAPEAPGAAGPRVLMRPASLPTPSPANPHVHPSALNGARKFKYTLISFERQPKNSQAQRRSLGMRPRSRTKLQKRYLLPTEVAPTTGPRAFSARESPVPAQETKKGPSSAGPAPRLGLGYR